MSASNGPWDDIWQARRYAQLDVMLLKCEENIWSISKEILVVIELHETLWLRDINIKPENYI